METGSRHSFTNQVIDTAIYGCPDQRWTRDIPFAALHAAFPKVQGVTPAIESDKGRGAPVFDLYNPELPDGNCLAPYLLSMKVSKEERHPRVFKITTGTDSHVEGVLDAIESGLHIPVLAWNLSGGKWYQLALRFDLMVMDYPPEGVDGAETYKILPCVRQYKRGGNVIRAYEYATISVSVKTAIDLGYTQGWVPCDGFPKLPLIAF